MGREMLDIDIFSYSSVYSLFIITTLSFLNFSIVQLFFLVIDYLLSLFLSYKSNYFFFLAKYHKKLNTIDEKITRIAKYSAFTF